jgi:hypothetical protein
MASDLVGAMRRSAFREAMLRRLAVDLQSLIELFKEMASLLEEV